MTQLAPADRIGSIAWLRASQGKLTLKTRLQLMREVLAPAMTGVSRSLLHLGKNTPLELDAIPLPDTIAVKHAIDALEDCATTGIIQHSYRTSLWGAGFGQIGKLDFDPELLLVGCLLHDVGMTPHLPRPARKLPVLCGRLRPCRHRYHGRSQLGRRQDRASC